MNQKDIARICRRIVAKALAIKEIDIDFETWHYIIYNFSIGPRYQAMTAKRVKTFFQMQVVGVLKLAGPETRNLAAKRLE